MKTKIILILLIIALSLPSIFSLFPSGFFQNDDGEWMIIRFSAFHQALRDGQFPVRFLSRLNYGYGYPVANFLYPGFMYLSEFPKILGFGFVNSIKIVLGLSMLGSAVFLYLWLSKFFDKISSLFGSLFYLYAPYHLYDLYKRGSVGEILALSILPFVLWQIERKSLFWSSMGIAFLILSHNTLALLFLPIVIFYILLNSQLLTLLGLGISAFFWIPAVVELRHTNFFQTQISDFRNYFADTDLIGISSFLVLILSFLLFYKVQPLKRLNLPAKLFTFFLIIAILSILLSSSLSAPLWEILPVSFVQFPFRFLSLAIFCASFLLAYSLSVLPKRLKTITGFLILISTINFSQPFLTPSQFFDKGEGFYATNEGTTTVQDEYMPKWVKVKPTNHLQNKIEVLKGDIAINNLSHNSKKIMFDTSSATGGKLQVNTIYYPGWKAFINGNETVIDYSNKRGLTELSIPKGKNSVVVTFTETPLRLVSDIVSILSLLLLMILCCKFRTIRHCERP